MRLKPEIIKFIKDSLHQLFPGVEIYLFGSRVDNNASGGDIDILLLSKNKLEKRKLRLFRLEFYKKFAWQKIDLVNFTKNENTTFKQIILASAKAI